MLPEWTLTQRMSKPLFGHREKSNLAPDQCEIVAGKAFSCPLSAFSMFSTCPIFHSVCCSLFFYVMFTELFNVDVLMYACVSCFWFGDVYRL